MAQWDWLVKPEKPYTWRFVRNVVIKGLALFAVVNVVFALLNPMPALGRLSLYNRVTPGRARLPYAENSDDSYSLSPLNLDAMFASHEIAGTPKAADEYRVLVIGDSSVWGVLLDTDQTLSAYLTAAQQHLTNGKRIRAYNIGYPIQSLTKDVMLLQYAMSYQPDLIVWMVTLESFAPPQQLASLLVGENPDVVRNLMNTYQIKSIGLTDPKFHTESFVDHTIIGQRRPLADLLRLQLYGPAWGITQIDQRYPRFYEPRRENFDTDVTWQGLQPQPLTTTILTFDVFEAGLKIAGQTPIIVINEPIFISHGVNSDLRYDFFYPRWAYDAYRPLLTDWTRAHNLTYVDLWDIVLSDQFTDSAVHLTPAGSKQLAARVLDTIVQTANKTP
ncbi:MAG: hypothetical protein ABI947_29105 [Chloroflexota bacterium]